MRFQIFVIVLMALVLIGIPVAYDAYDACAQGAGCCCQLADGSTCCTYDLNCLGCPCIF